jgi:hypothetical protein
MGCETRSIRVTGDAERVRVPNIVAVCGYPVSNDATSSFTRTL